MSFPPLYDRTKATPMVRQYLEIKKAHEDCILFFRLGDFYEMFFEDAKEAAAILKIALTSRGKMESHRIPMCGIPFHSAESYIQKLLEVGKKIAICEQMGDPEQAKGIVERKVVRIITPSLRPHDLESQHQHYLASVVIEKERRDSPERYGLSYVEVSTGQLRATVLSGRQSFLDELWRISPKELLWPSLQKDHKVFPLIKSIFPHLLINSVEETDLRSYPKEFEALMEGLSPLLRAASEMLFGYLKRSQYESSFHIQKIDVYETQKTMQLDAVTIRNLELFETQYEKSQRGSLFWLLDQTQTAMGRRLLRQWILYPLLDISEINKRQKAVGSLFEKPTVRQAIQKHLGQILDLERIIGRLTLGLSHARDLIALKNAFCVIPRLNECFREIERGAFPLFSSLADLLERGISEDAPLSLREGNIIREGFDGELDGLISLCRNGKAMLANMEQRERQRTGIGSLKVRYNEVSGYYIEVTKTHVKVVPDDYIRKQTLVNAERYITPELKKFEDKILSAEEKRKTLEYEIFEKIRLRILDEIPVILKFAHECATLDVFCAFAQVACENQYVCPHLTEDFQIDIQEGRHPVIEKISKERPEGQRLERQRFVPNSIRLDNGENMMLIITGPNMSGKSTIMRQVALISLLSQIGAFVPAEKTTLGIVDRVFTRVGAQDNLFQGESTFMVEMKETAHILRTATSRSLILLDEIGRGTSTFDGLSIAWGVATYIHDEIKAKTLFATHYHELTHLAKEKSRVQNAHVAVREIDGEIVFLRKLLPEGVGRPRVGRSYGIEVARLAGLPTSVIETARGVLKRLEERGETSAVQGKGSSSPRSAPTNLRPHESSNV